MVIKVQVKKRYKILGSGYKINTQGMVQFLSFANTYPDFQINWLTEVRRTNQAFSRNA
jgi:hypothetical protein